MRRGEVRLTTAGSVASVVLDNGKVNALTSDMLDQLHHLLAQVAADQSVKVVMLSGAGGPFSAGADLADLAGGLDGTPEASEDSLIRQTRIVELLRDMAKVTIAVIDGPCAGAGLSLALACDLRISTSRSRFKVAFVSAGMSGDFGISWMLPRAVGETRARELLLMDEKFDAEKALAWGLVSAVVDPEELDDTATRLSTALTEHSTIAVRAVKQNLVDSSSTSLKTHLRRESERHLSCAHSVEASVAAERFLVARRAD